MKNIHPEHVLGSLLCKPQYAMNHLQKVTATQQREGGGDSENPAENKQNQKTKI